VSEPGEIEQLQEIDAIPVLAPEPVVRRELARARAGRGLISSITPAAQAAAVAAGGFIAGAAIVGLASRRRARTARALGRGRGRGGRSRRELVQIVGTRSLLLDVHLLGGPGGDR